MSKIIAFIHVSVDGFYAGPNGEIDWFKTTEKDREYESFTHEQAQSGGTLLFGHTTYEMMKSYWPTAEATKNDPKMADVMRNSRKVVISKKLANATDEPNWKNIAVLHQVNAKEISELKDRESKDITILGSGSIVQQLANLRLLDGYQLVVVPKVLGAGKPLFKDVNRSELKLVEAKSFKNGIAWLAYRPA